MPSKEQEDALKLAKWAEVQRKGKEMATPTDRYATKCLRPKPILAVGDFVKFYDDNDEIREGVVDRLESTVSPGYKWTHDVKLTECAINRGYKQTGQIYHIYGDRIIYHATAGNGVIREVAASPSGRKPVITPKPMLKTGDHVQFYADGGVTLGKGIITSNYTTSSSVGSNPYTHQVKLTEAMEIGVLNYKVGFAYSISDTMITEVVDAETGQVFDHQFPTRDALTLKDAADRINQLAAKYDNNQERTTTMPIFNVIAVQKVTKYSEDKTESKQVERVILNKSGIVAPTQQTAALLAGRSLPTTVADEDIAMVTLTVTQVA